MPLRWLTEGASALIVLSTPGKETTTNSQPQGPAHWLRSGDDAVTVFEPATEANLTFDCLSLGMFKDAGRSGGGMPTWEALTQSESSTSKGESNAQLFAIVRDDNLRWEIEQIPKTRHTTKP